VRQRLSRAGTHRCIGAANQLWADESISARKVLHMLTGRGLPITYVYAVQDRENAIYQAGEVMVHFADDPAKAEAQIKYILPLSSARAEINALAHGLVHRDVCDGQVAFALQLALDGDMDGAKSVIAAAKTFVPVPKDIPLHVEDAIHLIFHLTGNGAPPREETISTVFSAKKAIQEHSWSIDSSKEFVAAYSELSKQAKPITARSLSESEGPSAKKSLKRWSWLVWLLLPVLVILSAISYANSRFLDYAGKLIDYSYMVEQPGFVPPIPNSTDSKTSSIGTNSQDVGPDRSQAGQRWSTRI
jgi:hypothetical protein